MNLGNVECIVECNFQGKQSILLTVIRVSIFGTEIHASERGVPSDSH
jgi:hypothetical protein